MFTQVTHLAHVIHAGVYDQPPGQDAVDACEGEEVVLHVDDRHAVLVCHDVAQVSHVSVRVSGSSVGQLGCYWVIKSAVVKGDSHRVKCLLSSVINDGLLS